MADPIHLPRPLSPGGERRREDTANEGSKERPTLHLGPRYAYAEDAYRLQLHRNFQARRTAASPTCIHPSLRMALDSHSGVRTATLIRRIPAGCAIIAAAPCSDS